MIDSGTFAMLVRTVFVTGAMIGALMLLARAAKKGRLDGVLSRWGANRSQDGIQITSRAQISKESFVVTVSWDSYEYLIAVTNGAVEVISNRKAAQEPKIEEPDFQTAFKKASSDRQVEDMMATTLATPKLIEKLRHITSRTLDESR